MARTIYVRNADYPTLFNQLKQQALQVGYTELFDFLDTWCDLHQHQNRYTGNINQTKWYSHQIDCMDNNKPYPVLPFKTITKQARDLGVKCKYASNSDVGHMNLREYV